MINIYKTQTNIARYIVKDYIPYLLIVTCLFISGCEQAEQEFTKTQYLMGTLVTIKIIHKDQETAYKAINDAFKEIERIEHIFSNTLNSSEVSRLNSQGYLENPSQELLYILNKSLYYSSISGGCFDITVMPILELYSQCFKIKKRPPSKEEIKEVLELVDYRNIIISEKNVSFAKKGMKITLGAIVKGYAIDRAAEIIKKYGIKNALINAGGDIYVTGYNRAKKPWAIALENPRNKAEYISRFYLSERAIATSGDYERYFDKKKRFHHIINPKTGYSATELISVTVISKTALDADALATSVFVMGPTKGLELINNMPGVDALVITADKRILYSDNIKKYILAQ